MPLAIYLARRTRNGAWLGAIAVLFVGIASTNSRTGLVMLLVVGIVFLWLRPKETVRLWPALIAGAVAVQLLVPGTLGSIKESFFPAGGLLAEQAQFAGWEGSGRIADLGPTLKQWSYQPLFGEGFGTRVTDPGPDQNALILDDQWLGTLVEVGAVGFIAWAWFFGSLVRRLGRAARRDLSDRGWLMAALAASIAAFASGMLTYDAFSFIQVTFVAFVIAAMGAVVLRSDATDLGAAPGGDSGPGKDASPRRRSPGFPGRRTEPTIRATGATAPAGSQPATGVLRDRPRTTPPRGPDGSAQ
jgi:hypothetical protein